MIFEELLEQFDAAGNAKKKVNVIKGWTQEQRKAFFRGLTSEQKIDVMDSLGAKGKVLLYNAVDITERKKFLELLTESAKDAFIEEIRAQAVTDFWSEEKILIRQGKGTYNWTVKEQEYILHNNNHTIDGITYEGHHMYSVKTYPEYAGDWRNIQALNYTEHQSEFGAHNGNTKVNQTKAYFDELIMKNYDFSVDPTTSTDRLAPVFELTNVCDEVKKMDSYVNAVHKDYSEIIPNYVIMDDISKIQAQKFEYIWSLKRGSDPNIPDDFEKYIAKIYTDPVLKQSDDICEKMAKKIFIETKGNKALIAEIEKMSTENAYAFLSRNSFYSTKISDAILKNEHLGIVSSKTIELNAWFTKMKAELFNTFIKDESVLNLIKGGGKTVITVLNILDFIEVSVDVFIGLKYNTMSESEAGRAITECIFATAYSEVGAVAGATLIGAVASLGGPVAGAIGAFLGGLVGGTLGYVIGGMIGGEFYDKAYSDVFSVIDSLSSDGHHVLEGTRGNDCYNFANGQGTISDMYRPYRTYYIDGLDGNDYIAGYKNDDKIVGGMGYDMLVGAGGDDTIYGDNENEDTPEGGNDIIYGGSGNDTIYGGGGDDIIYGMGIWTNDSLMGANDGVFRFPFELMLITFDFNPYSEDDLTDNDTIHGGSGNDIIYGGPGENQLWGGSGDDQIYGGQDDDYIFGNSGNDFIESYGGLYNFIDGGRGDDCLFCTHVGYSAESRTEIYGGEGNDTIKTNGGNNKLVGGTGDDWIIGGDENDVIFGDDELYTAQEIDGSDTIHGGAGDDKVYAGGGNDIIYGDNGIDSIHGSDGDDQIYGGDDKDYLYGDAGNDTIYGDGGNDLIYGGSGNDIVYGGIGDDKINGGDGWDNLYGNTGDDEIYGLAGRDILDGGSGDDKLYGGDENDSFFFYYGYGHDTIFDMYGISNIELDELNIDDLDYNWSDNSSDLVISFFSTDDTLTIKSYVDYYDNYYFWINDESYQIIDNGNGLNLVLNEKSNIGIVNGYKTHWDKLHDNTSNNNIKKYESATVAQPPRDPLVIDLGTPGIDLTTIDDGVYFDLDKNGFAEKTAWIGTEDGFLVLDRNGNGIIDDGGELFSDQVEMSDHSLSTSGFAALSELDENGDGVIDINDSRFDSLQIWVDANHDGNSENELHSLEELGITSISLNHIQTDTVDSDTGTIVTESSVVTFANGTVREISEHWFQINSADTEEITVTDVENDLTSFGNMHSLSYALENDESGELQTLVDSFKNSDNFIEKRVIARKILYFITGSSDIIMNSRGGAIDARSLHVLEMIMGVDSFVGVNGSTTPNSTAASILNQLFMDFDRTYFNLLNKVLGVADYLEMIEENPNENGEIVLDLTSVEEVVDHYISIDMNVNEMLYNIGVYVKTYDSTYGTNYLSFFISHYPDYAAEIAAMVNSNFVVGTDENDTLNGSSTQDVIWAEGGDDRINTGSGNDIIYGGTGNDTINAGSGDDVVYGDEGDDDITGGDGNDLIYGGDGDDIIKGNTGNDTIYGGIGNDTLDGGEDDDTLYGEDGDDSLSGGTGDDMLSGGDGNDTYYINADHGNDTIYDSEGLSTLVFGDELSADDYSLHIDINSGISLVNTETGETISIPDFINMPEFYDFTFDGEAQIIGGGDSRQVIEGTDEDDVITGGDGFNIIKGNDGNDIITGGDNLNFIYGGDGDDTITGGNGTNIIRAENGNDVIRDGVGDSYLDGGNGNDTIYGGDGNDIIIGGAGNDQLFGEDGDDVIAGNDGDDVLYGEDGNDTLYADAGNDVLYGGNGNDSLFGGDGDDTLYGDAGDDYLEAENGTDTLYGGVGNDTFVGGEGINYMYGEEGDDTFYGGNALNYMYGGDGDDNFTGGELADYIEGGAGNDTMNGGNGSNEMYGGDGDDYVYGGNDDDYIEGGNGDDHLYGGNGVNTIYGGAGNDIIYSGDNGSFLYGGDGDDQIYAGGGADVLDGGAGNDYLQGDHGGDTYVFGIGYDIDTINASADLNTILIHGYTAADMHNTRMANNDLVIDFGIDTGDRLIIQGFFNFNSNRDFNFVFDDETVLGQHDIQAVSAPIYGTDADEWLSVQGNDDGIIYAGAGNDGLSGGSGNDELYGEDGDDTLYGNDGNDTLDGVTGNDTLCGGNGTDTYIFAKGYGNDTINEWGSDRSIVKLTDINSDEVTITDQWGSNLVVSINGTDDTLIISNFKWGQATYSFEFADGAIATVNKDTWKLEFSKLPDILEMSEDELVQENADILSEIYADDSLTSDLLTESDSTVISDISDSVSVTDESDEVTDQTDIQVMILTENMSAFANEDNVFDNADVFEPTDDMSMMNQLLVGSQVQ